MRTISCIAFAAGATLLAGTGLAQNIEPTIVGGTPAFGGGFEQSNAIDGIADPSTAPFAGNTGTEFSGNTAGDTTFLVFDLGGAQTVQSITFTDRIFNPAGQPGDNIVTGRFTFSADNSFAAEGGPLEPGDVAIDFTDATAVNNSAVTTIIPGPGTPFQFVRFDAVVAGGGNIGASDISFFANVVPEPATLGLLGLGSLGLLARRRRA